MWTEELLPDVVTEFLKNGPIKYVVHRFARPRTSKSSGMLPLLQGFFRAGTVQNIREPLFERVVVKLLDEGLPLLPVQHPRPGQTRGTRGAGWGASVIAELRNPGVIERMGEVQLKTAWATHVSRTIGLET